MSLKELNLGFKRWLDTGLGFIYPEVCQICGDERATVEDGFVGLECWKRVRFIEQPYCSRCGLPFSGEITNSFTCGNCHDLDLAFRSARSAAIFNDFLKHVLHLYKYNRALWFEPFLADLLIRRAAAALHEEGCDLIVPMPLHRHRRREREFNQAERLSQRLSCHTKIPMNAGLLERVKPTLTQTHLDRAARAENVRGAFALRPGVRLQGQRVVLVDDVLTTGATTNACAKVLRAAGAGEVSVWTVARGVLN